MATSSILLLLLLISCCMTDAKMLEGRFRRVFQSSGRVRRSAKLEFLPLEYFGSLNPDSTDFYPLSSSGSVPDNKTMFAYEGVPRSPQATRLRGELSNMNPNEGRVELEYRKSWGLVCDDFFGKTEADVYCKNLGFTKGANRPYVRSFFGTASYRRFDILIGGVKCKGYRNEKTLLDCYHNVMPFCSLGETAGVECTYNDGCAWGWSSYDGICYRVETDSLSPDEAARACRAKGAKLAFVMSEKENNFITNMLYTKFKNVKAIWTSGRYAKFKDVSEFKNWTFKDTIHLIEKESLWFPGFKGNSGAAASKDQEQKSCIAMSRVFTNPSTNSDVEVNYYWWDRVSCKQRLPFLCQKLASDTKDCYSGKGETYRGETARTDNGTPCLAWSDNSLVNPVTHPNSGLGLHNFCRNPDGDSRPWCWVDNERNVFGYCNLRNCGSNSTGDGGRPPNNLKPGFNNSKCDSKDDFFCPSMINYRPVCISKSRVCDTYKDCVGGEDEDAVFCKNYKCKGDQFYCRKSHRCIRQSQICDGVRDCEYGDDETEETCKKYQQQVPTEVTGYNRTGKAEESAIPESAKRLQFYGLSLTQCKSQCDTSRKFVCNGFLHYENYTKYNTQKCILMDKALPTDSLDVTGGADCFERLTACNSSSHFSCNNTRCVEQSKVCDGYDNCGDFSDEIGPAGCPDPFKSFSVQLRGGSGSHEGRIEVKILNERGLVCDDKLDAAMANVTCRQLGLKGYEKIVQNARKKFGRGSGQFLLQGVTCTGSESSLHECKHGGWHNTSCGINNIAGVVCLTDRACTDKEFRCPDRCLPLKDVCNGVVQCSGGVDEENCGDMSLALRNGNGTSGIVEITRGNLRGAVCDDSFGDAEAAVVCRQLNISGAAAKVSKSFSTPAGLVMLLQDVRCLGNETSLFNCRIRNWGQAFCDIGEAVAVQCGLPTATTATTAAATQEMASSTASPPVTCGQRIGSFTAGRIINGFPAVVGQFPWQVGIRLRLTDTETQQWCGGTVISDRWIITASHCFEYAKSSYVLRVGDVDNTKTEEFEREFEIDLLILHPQYAGSPSFDYDITLIRIKPDSKGFLTFNKGIQPACLPDADLVVPDKTVCHISGWGSVGDYELPDNLMAANVPLIDNSRCNQLYPNRITDRMQCAGFEAGGIDSCQGDSGGPLVCKVNGLYTILGATSWGEGCAMPGAPGVYANVRNLRSWIDETIKNNS